MNMIIKQTLGAGVLSAVMMSSVWAAPAEQPDVFVKNVADSLLDRLNAEKKKGTLNNPAVVNSIVRQNLDPYLDAQGFANTVMGVHARGASVALRKKFAANLHETLIESYGSSFAKFGGQSYSMQRYKPSANPKNAQVNINFHNQGDKIPVTFQLVDLNNQWKIRNIRVSGVDIALQFKNQFNSTVSRQGSVEKAVDNFKPNADAALKK